MPIKQVKTQTTVNSIPLAERMRPQDFDGFFGQTDIVGQGKILRKLIESDDLTSLIFWGPPGVGKTTLAKIIAAKTKSHFIQLSAVMSGKDELREAVAQAKEIKEKENRRTILFIDEIHRWNKAQQDALLPYVEQGDIILIGATTENPSFEIIRALLSRSRVFVLKSLSEEELFQVVKRALVDENVGLGTMKIKIDDEVIKTIVFFSGGDARTALNILELAVKLNKEGKIDKSDIKESAQKVNVVFDKQGEEFYNLISALHKSMRGSDPDASIYWLCRMLQGGADPLYVARRVVRFASEDIGMANGEALIQANAAYDACHRLGMPECGVHLAQAVVYCAKSAKSNLLYVAYEKAMKDAEQTSHLGVPLHLRNAPTQFMKDIGYSDGYKYNPDFDGPVEQEYLPEELKGKKYLKK
ncbi:MAG TPA: replication-associated recombination protein A [Candidatus Magasanikbacteria bacterium]|nr:replication-associated recombination protein A [Candidatus Magasanikbacteria bacterium]